MGAILHHITDPRDSLEKATRYELVEFANANGMKDVSEAMPAILIRRKLRAAGLTNIKVPPRLLGIVGGEMISDDRVPPTDKKVVEVDADDDLARQFEQEQTDPSKMSMNELRAACKERGIKMDRTDNTQSLRDKLRGSNAA